MKHHMLSTYVCVHVYVHIYLRICIVCVCNTGGVPIISSTDIMANDMLIFTT